MRTWQQPTQWDHSESGARANRCIFLESEWRIMSLSHLSIEKYMVSSGRDVGDVCPLKCGGSSTAAMEASTVHRPCGPQRRSVENQSHQGTGHCPRWRWNGQGVHPITIATQAKERKSILFRALFLKERNVMLQVHHGSRSCSWQGNLYSVLKPRRLWHIRPGPALAVVPGMQLSLGQQLLCLAPSKGRAVQKFRILLASGMSVGSRVPREGTPGLIPHYCYLKASGRSRLWMKINWVFPFTP